MKAKKGNELATRWQLISLQILLRYLLTDNGVAGGDHVAGQGEESGGQAGLGQHPILDLVEADRLVIPPPVPARYVQQVGLC